MRKLKLIITLAGGLLLGRLLGGAEALGENVSYTIVPAQSSITITPAVSVFPGTPLTVQPQGPTSYTASYSGSINADLTPTSIQFQPTTNLIAGISGNWLPGTNIAAYNPEDIDGSAAYLESAEPANYGLDTYVEPLVPLGLQGKHPWSPSAIRDLEISLTNSTPLALAAGTYNPLGTATELTDGTVYYSSGGLPPTTDLTVSAVGHTPLTAGIGTLSTSGSLETLTVPVNFTVSYNVVYLTITTVYAGEIVATRFVPEPASLAMLPIVGLPLLARRRRRAKDAVARND